MSSQSYDPKDITTPTPQAMAGLFPIIPSGTSAFTALDTPPPPPPTTYFIGQL